MIDEERVLAALSGVPLDVAELQQYTGIPVDDLRIALTALETRGLVLRLPGLGQRPAPLRFTCLRR